MNDVLVHIKLSALERWRVDCYCNRGFYVRDTSEWVFYKSLIVNINRINRFIGFDYIMLQYLHTTYDNFQLKC